jgi:hypothetical protein
VDTSSPQTGGYLQILLLLALLIPAILFLLSQQNTLKTIKKENRLLHPGLVWLQLIPLFGQAWQFFVVTRIADSIRKELSSLQDDSILGFSDTAAVEQHEKRPTFAIGTAYCALYTTGIFTNLFQTSNVKVKNVNDIDLLSMIISFSILGGMVCWIVYWVQLAKYKRKLRQITG